MLWVDLCYPLNSYIEFLFLVTSECGLIWRQILYEENNFKYGSDFLCGLLRGNLDPDFYIGDAVRTECDYMSNDQFISKEENRQWIFFLTALEFTLKNFGHGLFTYKTLYFFLIHDEF